MQKGCSWNSQCLMACYEPYPLCHLSQLWLIRIASTYLYNQHTGRLPTTSASNSARFINMKMEAVCSSKILWPTFNYLVWKTQKWLPYKTVSIQVMKAQLHTFLTAVLNGTISFMTQGFILGMHLIGDWVGPKTGLDSLDKRKILFISHELNHDLSEASPLHFIWSI